MLTYVDFCNSFAFKNCAGNSDAQNVFDFLCKPETIHNMMVFTNLELPAISGVAKNLENMFANAPLFPLTNPQNRQIVRRMVKFILGYFGYEPLVGGLDDRARLRNFSGAKHFKTASVYELKNTPTNSIVMKII